MSEPGERMLDGSTPPNRDAVARWIGAANTYHDGKWLVLHLDGDELLDDVATLLMLKRQPRPYG